MAERREESIVSNLLRRAHSPDTAETIHRERVKQRPLLLRPSSPDAQANARSKRQHERVRKATAARRSNKPRPLSAKQKRALCLYEVPKEQQKYAIYEPLLRMWCEYLRDILALSGGKRTFVDPLGVGPILAAADFHGALLEVVRSRCVSRVGLKGIVVRDTKFTFDIITTHDVLKTVPKEHTVFRFEVPFEEVPTTAVDANSGRKPLVFEIHGSQFESRAPDRANKKFRPHPDPDL